MKIYITPQELREIADSLEDRLSSTTHTYMPMLNDKTGNGEFFCHMNAKPDFEIFVVDGKQDFSEHEIVNWSKDILKTKYPNHNDFIDLLKTPESVPKYTKPENSIGYYPNFGFSKVVDEFSKLN